MEIQLPDKTCSVVHLFEAYKIYQESKETEKVKFLLVSGKVPPNTLRMRASELINIGVEKKDIFVVPVEFVLGETDKLQLISYENYSYLDHVEFHLTNRCNINCKGCGHFMPIIPKGDEIDYDELKGDLGQLKKRVGHIHDLCILGGEPLLSPHLDDCIKTCRELFPYSNLIIVTNGLLLEQLDSKTVDSIKNNEVIILVSQYYTFADKYSDIYKYCKEKGLKVADNTHLTRWFKKCLLPLDTEHRYPSHHNLFGCGCSCHFLWKGRVFACPLIGLIQYFNNYFDTEYPQSEEDGVDLYCDDLSGEKLYESLTTPRKICDYCYAYMNSDKGSQIFDEEHGLFEHRINQKPSQEDWIKQGER